MLAMLIAVTMNKTFIRHVNIVRNVSHDHQHVHIHSVDADHIVILIVGYVLLGVSLIIIGSLIVYGIKKRHQLLARLRRGSENIGLY